MDRSTLLLLLFAGAVLYRLARSVLTALQRRRFRRAHNCQPPSRLASGPWGVYAFVGLLSAARRKEHLQYIVARYTSGMETFAMSHFGTDLIQTMDPGNIKTVLATKFSDYQLGVARHDSFRDLFGDGIFTLDGAGWEHSRALLRPQFSRKQVADVGMLSVHVSRVLAHLAAVPRGQPVDLQPLFFALTLDSATEFLFGETAGSLLRGADDREGFAYNFNQGLEWIMFRLRLRAFPLVMRWKPAAMRRCNEFVHRFVDGYVAHALDPTRKRDAERYVFLDAVAAHSQDPKLLRDQMLNILLAGRDTTAGLIGWTMYLLAGDARVYAKLRGELEAAFGTGVPGAWRSPSFEELKDVVYLRHVLNEALRLYPAVPLNLRTAIRDTVLPRGGGVDGQQPMHVHRGQRVQYSVFALHRRTDLYGADAAEFRPERWGEGKAIGRGWEYLPFNGGPRICLGQQYALTEAGYTVVKLLQRFKGMELAKDRGVTRIQTTLTIAPETLWVRLVPVDMDTAE